MGLVFYGQPTRMAEMDRVVSGQQGAGCRVQGQDLGFGVQGVGFRVSKQMG